MERGTVPPPSRRLRELPAAPNPRVEPGCVGSIGGGREGAPWRAARRFRERRSHGGGGAAAVGPCGSAGHHRGAAPWAPPDAVGRRDVPADAGDGAAAREPQHRLHRGLQQPRVQHQRHRGGRPLCRAAPRHPPVERRITPRHLAAEPVAVPPAGAADRDPGAGHGGQSRAAPSRRAEADAAVRDRRGGAGHAQRVCHLQLPDKREAPDSRRPHPPAGHQHGAPGAALCHGLSASVLSHPQRRGCPTPSAGRRDAAGWAVGAQLLAECCLSAVEHCTAVLGSCTRRIHINQKYKAITEWLTLSKGGL